MAKTEKKITWQRLWARKYSLYFSSGFIWGFTKYKGFDMCQNKLFVPEGKLYACYFAEHEFKKLIKNFTAYLMTREIAEYAKEYEQFFIDYFKWTQKFSQQNFSQFSNEEIIESLKEFFERFYDSFENQFLAFVVLEGPNKTVERKLATHPQREQILRAISTPHSATQIVKARLELLKLVRDKKVNQTSINSYAKKYAWIPVYEIIDKPWTARDIRKQIGLITDAAEELKTYKDQKQEDLKVYRQYLKSIKDEKFKKLVEIVHHFAYLKEMRDDHRRHSYYLLQPFWREIAKRTGLTFVETQFLTHEELMAWLSENKKIAKNEIKARQKTYSLLLEDGQLKVFTKDISDQYLGSAKQAKTDVIRGQTAYHGKVQGRVKIIYHQGEFAKLKQGDILVTTMTHPEFLSVMKKAKAIVTDEGGITCHAAIVAREMKKPCIIGTKIATQAFKDGDKVEVDASKGIVKKI